MIFAMLNLYHEFHATEIALHALNMAEPGAHMEQLLFGLMVLSKYFGKICKVFKHNLILLQTYYKQL